MKKTQENKKNLAQGSLFTIIIIILLIAGITIAGINTFTIDRAKTLEKNHVKQLANNEAQNSLSYAIWLLNTPKEKGGGKCNSEFYLKNKDIEINDNEKLPKTDTSYIVKRFFRLEGNDEQNIKLIGIAQIYNLDETFLQERKTELNVNLLYKGNDENANNPCDARVLRLNLQSWKQK